MSGQDGAADGDVGRSRLPGESQREVRPPREHRLPPRWWIAGGVALVVVGVVGLSIMMATSMALPATFLVLVLLVPVGIGVALRGFALERRATDGTSGETPPDPTRR